MINGIVSDVQSTVESAVKMTTETIESSWAGHSDVTKVENGLWTRTISLNRIPTQPDNLKVDLLDRNLEIRGTSEQKSVENGFEIESVHKWTKIVQIPENVDLKTVDVKLKNQTTLTIKGSCNLTA